MGDVVDDMMRVDLARRLVRRPWLPIDSAPRDGRQIIGLWRDCDRTWNAEFVEWSRGNNSFMTHSGMLVRWIVGWLRRPPLPGRARLK